MPSYHDVVVYCNNVEYIPSQNYALQLICTKAGGWNLYHTWDSKENLIGGEYSGEPFCIVVKGMVICGKKPKKKDIKKPENIGGWNGIVING